MLSGYYILNENNEVVQASFEEFFEWLKVNKSRHVANETINGFRVSTIFLSKDYGVLGYGTPILFETMIFTPDGEPAFQYQERCSTWEQAEEMHERAVLFTKARTTNLQG